MGKTNIKEWWDTISQCNVTPVQYGIYDAYYYVKTHMYLYINEINSVYSYLLKLFTITKDSF